MSGSAESHLTRLAATETGTRLTEMGFTWDRLAGNVCAALRFKREVSQAPPIVGLIGGASSGKSTLFNSLLRREVSRISAHAHETLGPVVAVPATWLDRFASWSSRRLLFPGFETDQLAPDKVSIGRLGAVAVCSHEVDALANVILLDLPDVTSKMSADEGSTTHTLLPWFDGLVVVVDEERWFDATVFDETSETARNFGPRVWVTFNRTDAGGPLTPQEGQQLADHAASRHAAASCISPFQPGSGYRPLSPETCDQLHAWLGGLDSHDRQADLQRDLQRRCAEMVGTNVTRGEQFAQVCHDVDRELATLSAETSLSADLLTQQERAQLGLGRRFVPLFDALQNARRWLDRLGRRRAAHPDVDFEKRNEELAEVLRRNLDHRVQHATDRINRIIAGSEYLGRPDGAWQPNWTPPQFDEREWAVRIRAHLDAWKAESAKQSRRGDVAALSVGMPLLLADLLFLGGAGLTLSWAVASVAALIGGKSMVGLLQRSPAFKEYQTTVRAYQSLIREALTEQWEANLAAMPRRHLPMSDPLLESLMYWATPVRR